MRVAPRHGQQGFSLPELMIALAILAIVTAQFLLAFTNQQRNYVEQERVVDAQEDARLVLELILADLRMAGFMVPHLAGVFAIDGGANGSDVLCVSDPSRFDTATVSATNSRFEGASLSGALGSGSGSVSLVSSSMDIDGDGNDDFAAGGGILISDESSAHCALITGVAGSTVSFDDPTPGGFGVAPPDARAVPAVIYRVVGGQLMRNGLALSPQVEDVQLEFAVDEDDDGQIDPGEFPIADLAGSTLSRVESARVYVTARPTRADPGFQGAFPQAANRAAGAADQFRRRRLIGDARLRNMR